MAKGAAIPLIDQVTLHTSLGELLQNLGYYELSISMIRSFAI